MTSQPRSMVIAGAGIAGLTLASACAKTGIKVDVVERTAEPGEVGAGIQLSANAMHVLSALGLGEALGRVAFAPERAVFRRYRDGRPLLTASLNPEHSQRYGQPYLHIHRADLHTALVRAATDFGARLHFGQPLEAFEVDKDGVTVTCDTARFKADILAGADGVRSTVRQRAFGAGAARFTGQTAWRGLVHTDRISGDPMSPDANAWLGPGRHFVAYYVRGGSLINFVAVREQAEWVTESWRTSGRVEDVRSTFAGWDPRIAQLLAACDKCYEWGLHDRPALADWHRDRIVLLGDACHPMLPFMAQGAAMAIEDAWVLATLLSKPGLSLPAAFERYQRSRQTRTARVQALSTRNARRYHRSDGLGAVVRNLGFRLATAVPALARGVLDPVYGLDVTKSEV